MAPLFLNFYDGDRDLLGRFSRTDFETLDINFAEGSSPKKTSGTVVFSGVAFDYSIMAAARPDASHKIFCDTDLGKVRSAISLSLGGAVASGQQVPSIINTLMLLGEILGTALAAKSVFWTPASVATGFSYYAETVRQYVNGAAFPALITIAFDTSGGDCIRTDGLGWLVGQELRFERDGMQVNEAMRYVVRLVHDMATNGAVNSQIEVPGMTHDERLELVPDTIGGILNVRRKYIQNGANSAG